MIYIEFISYILILVGLIIIKLISKSRQVSKLDKNIPGPTSYPIVGSLFKLSKKPHLNFTELSKTYGDIYRITLGCREFVVLNGNNIITEAFVNKSIEFAGRPDLSMCTILSDYGGFAFMDYSPKWKSYRKLLVRGINHIISPHNQVQVFTNSMNKLCHQFVNLMLEYQGKSFNPTEDLRNNMFLFISSFTFGQEFDKFDKTILNFFKKNEENAILMRKLTLGDFFPFLKPFLGSIATLRHMLQEEIDSIDRMFKDKLTMDRDSENILCASDAFRTYAERDDIRKETGEKISNTEILHLLFALFGAGIDTTVTYIQFSLLYAIAFPEQQKIIQNEIDQVLSSNEAPSIENVNRLVKLKAFMFETERFSCFLPLGLTRNVTRDTTLKSFFIPKGTAILPNIYSAHFESSVWNNPEKFDPSRFLNSDDNSVDNNIVNKLLLFGGGRRRCPGQYLARIKISIILANLFKLCTFEAAPGEIIDINDNTFSLLLQPKLIKMIISARK